MEGKETSFVFMQASVQFSSVQFNCSVMSDSLQPHGLQHPRLPCPSPTPESCSYLSPFESVMPSNHLILCQPPSPPALNLSQPQSLFQWVGSMHQLAKALELQLHHQSYQWVFRVDFLWDWWVWSPCCPRNSQESSPSPQFESINLKASRYL